VLVLRLLPSVKPDDICEELYLLRRKLSVGTVNLPENVPGIKE
jgi:hypothetical protein